MNRAESATLPFVPGNVGSVLDALIRPGSVQILPAAALAGPDRPVALAPATTAVLLTLLAESCMLWLVPRLMQPTLQDWLQRRTGAQLQSEPAQADCALALAAEAEPSLWHDLSDRSDRAQSLRRGATLIIEVPGLLADPAPPRLEPGDMDLAPHLSLRGPGIADVQHLSVAGLSRHFWRTRIACETDRPRGVDLILCCGNRIVAIPHSVRVTLHR
ncbi:MAG: phosphonate C-P lyase system protein PhnH [Leptothrix sp. (in: b-proteobacteria)]